MTTAPATAEPTWYRTARETLGDIDTFVRVEWPAMSTPAKAATVLGLTSAGFGVLALVLGVGWAATSLLGALLHLAGGILADGWHWAQTTHAADAADRLVHVVSDPVAHYLAGHSAALPFAPGDLFTGWWVTGALLWFAAVRSTGLTGRAIAWSTWAALTTATVWAGTEAGSRWTVAAVAALLLAYSSPRPLLLPTWPRRAEAQPAPAPGAGHPTAG